MAKIVKIALGRVIGEGEFRDLGGSKKMGRTNHTDPEHRLGFFECLTGSEELLAITACVQNIYKKNWNVSISTF